uniref:Uncharacterized protein n=1 Tax=Oncorhynchus tshawytscha TaxID=74940 RepID=A0AAZ3S4H0_ONCTS
PLLLVTTLLGPVVVGVGRRGPRCSVVCVHIYEMNTEITKRMKRTTEIFLAGADTQQKTTTHNSRLILSFSLFLGLPPSINSDHLCNNSIQKHFQPSQWRHPEVPEDNMRSCSQFKAFLRAQGQGSAWGVLVVPGVVQGLVEGRRGSFELYGADFMLGRDLRHWLLEINATMAITAHLCPAVQLDNLRVVLDRREDPGAYTGGFQLIYKQVKTGIYTECTKH